MNETSYLSDVSLHHTNRIYQDISGQTFYLLTESGAEQKGCEDSHAYIQRNCLSSQLLSKTKYTRM